MTRINYTLKIQSTIKEKKEWETTQSLPEDEDFSQHFQVRKFTYRNHEKY